MVGLPHLSNTLTIFSIDEMIPLFPLLVLTFILLTLMILFLLSNSNLILTFVLEVKFNLLFNNLKQEKYYETQGDINMMKSEGFQIFYLKSFCTFMDIRSGEFIGNFIYSYVYVLIPKRSGKWLAKRQWLFAKHPESLARCCLIYSITAFISDI